MAEARKLVGASLYLTRKVVFEYRLLGRIRRKGKTYKMHLSRRQVLKIAKIISLCGEHRQKHSIEEIFSKIISKEIKLD